MCGLKKWSLHANRNQIPSAQNARDYRIALRRLGGLLAGRLDAASSPIHRHGGSSRRTGIEFRKRRYERATPGFVNRRSLRPTRPAVARPGGWSLSPGFSTRAANIARPTRRPPEPATTSPPAQTERHTGRVCAKFPPSRSEGWLKHFVPSTFHVKWPPSDATGPSRYLLGSRSRKRRPA